MVLVLRNRLARNAIEGFGSVLIMLAVFGSSSIPLTKVRHIRVAISELTAIQSAGEAPRGTIQNQASKILSTVLDLAFYPTVAVLGLFIMIAVILWHMPSSATR
jgi:hypothetical protein